MVHEGSGPEWLLFLVTPGSYKVAGTWFTSGMRATGSNTIITEDVLVPASRVVRVSDLRVGKGPGGALHANPIYRAQFFSFAPLTFAAPILGAAQGAYAYFRDWSRERKAGRGIAVA